MTAQSDQSAAEIETQIERTRARMDETLTAIERKLSLGQLVDEAVDYVRGGPGEFATNLGRTMRDNPVPVALLGISLSWLAVSGRHGGHRGNGRFGAEWQAHYATGDGSSAGERMAERAEVAMDAASEAGHRVGQLATDARHRLDRAAERTQHQIESARNNFSYLLREQPLVLGMMGVALGAALGALLPGTRAEDEAMGEARDSLKETAVDNIEEGIDKAGQVASRAIDEARKEAAAQGLTSEKDGPGESSISTASPAPPTPTSPVDETKREDGLERRPESGPL